MKKILLLVSLLCTINVFGQISILDGNQLSDKFPNGLVGYMDIDGDLLFDGKASEKNISEFKNHSDFSEISYYDWMAFEGELLKSNSVHIQYYCDKDAYPISVKQIFFKKYVSIIDGFRSTVLELYSVDSGMSSVKPHLYRLSLSSL